MGYSRNPAVARKILPQLGPMLEGRPCAWNVDPGPDKMGAVRWAQKIREAFSIARRFPGEFPQLATAATRFTIEVLDDSTVQARVRRNTHAVVEEAHSDAQLVERATPVQGLEDASPMDLPLSVVGPKTARDIIQHWINVQTSQATSNPMHFPDAQLDDREMDTLARWAARRTPPWIVIRQPGTSTVILSTDQPSIPESVKWRPST